MSHQFLKVDLPDDQPNSEQRRWIHWVRFVKGQWQLDHYPLEFSVSSHDQIVRPEWMNDPLKTRAVLLFYYPHFARDRKTLNRAQSMLIDIENSKDKRKLVSQKLRRIATFGDALLYFSRCTDPSENLRLYFVKKLPVPLSVDERRRALEKLAEELVTTERSQKELVELMISHKRPRIPVLGKLIETPTFYKLLRYCGWVVNLVAGADSPYGPYVYRLKRRAKPRAYPPSLLKLRDELICIEQSLSLYEDEIADPDLTPE